MLETYVVHVTKKCNCNCGYCYEDDKVSEYQWEDIKTLIDTFTKYNNKFQLEFLGGEPCLRIDLIEQVVEYTPQASGFAITTNGTVVDDRLINLMKKHSNVHWAASIDGHHWANSMRVFHNGVNTHDKVIENFRKLVDAGIPANQLSCHITTHLYNIAYLYDSVKHLYDIGFRGIGVGTIESTMRIDERYCNSFKAQMMKISRHIHAGLFPGINLYELESLKPPEDERHYIYDNDGKMIGESYGRADNDIVSQEIEGMKSVSVSSDLEKTIVDIRKFVYDYHHSHRRIYGCGTGRCGSKTLAKHIAHKEHYGTSHEGVNIPWNYDESVYDEIRKFDVNQVASGLINYADHLLTNTTCKFVCVRRNKQDFIDSFIQAHQLEPDGLWKDIQNPEQFPSFDHDVIVSKGLDMYWEMYYTMAEELNQRFGGMFQIIEFEDLIKSDVPDVSDNGEGFYDYGDKLVNTLI